jgi:hypothetical protein
MKLTGPQATILAAIIALIGLIAVNFRQFDQKRNEKEYIGRVVYGSDKKPVVGAEVTLDLGGVSFFARTNELGVYTFSLSTEDNTKGKMIVTADGFQTFDGQVVLGLSTDVIYITDVELVPIYEPNATATITITPTVTPTITLSYFEKEYFVLDGDNLAKISRKELNSEKYGGAIGRANCTDIIHTGDVLILRYYEVQAGDYLYLIATQYGTSLERLQEVNRFVNYEIIPGQVVFLPVYEQCN